MKQLEGKVAIVTGATKKKGLGKAVAVELASQGATVVLTGRKSSETGMLENVKDIKAMGVEAMGVLVDVSDAQQVSDAIDEVVAKFGRIDILVNSAGIGAGSAILEENTDRDWDANYAVNVKGTMAMCAGVLAQMEKNGGGAIVNVASTAGIAASPGMPYAYVATKHALVGASKVMALEYASKGIRVNVIAPGAIATDMLLQAYEAIAGAEGISIEEAAKAENASIPMGRPAEPSEIASAAVFLASPAASYVTGITLPVAGGMAPGI